ncbi:MAG: TorF family putative porin [Verrucomicrobiota bacterium]
MEKTVMRNVVAMCAVAAVSAVATARAGEAVPVEAELGLDVMNQYVWRGILVHEDTAFQPSFTVSSGGLSANVWADFSDEDLFDDVTEIDYTLSYGFSPSEAVDMELGYIHYTFDNADDDTGELYASIGFPTLMLSPSATLYYDVVEVDGAYLSLAAEHSMPLGEHAELTLSGAVGFMDSEQAEIYMNTDEAGIADASLTASVGMDLTDALSMSVSGAYSVLVDDEYRENMDDDDNFTFGVQFSYSF